MLKLAVLFFVARVAWSLTFNPPLPTRGAGPCFNERRSILVKNSGIGQYVPQCTDGGWYNYVQSHGSTGLGWCVNPETGTEVQGTKARGLDPATCPKCYIMLASKLAPAGSNIVGGCPPQCDANGNFTPLQSCGSTGYRWCVNPATGDQIGEKKPPAGEGPGQDIVLAC